MIIVPEKEIAGLIGRQESFDAVESVFAAMAGGAAYNFPVIREAIGHADALYGFKSGFDRSSLALGLKSRGYSVSLMTSTRFAEWIGAYGVDFLPMSDDTLAQIETDDGRAVLDSSTGWFKRLKAGRRLAQKAKPFAKQMIEDAWAGARAFEPDLIIFHPKVLGAPHIAEKLRIPAMLVFLQPMFVPTSAFPVPGFPALPLPGYNRLSYGIVSLSFGLYRKPINQFRRQIGLPAISAPSGLAAASSLR